MKLEIRRPTLADLVLASDSRDAIMDRAWYERRRDQLIPQPDAGYPV